MTSKGQRSNPPKKKFRNTFIPVYNRYIHSKPTQKSGWSLAGCIGCCNMLSAATKLRRLALCAFIQLKYGLNKQSDQENPALWSAKKSTQASMEIGFWTKLESSYTVSWEFSSNAHNWLSIRLFCQGWSPRLVRTWTKASKVPDRRSTFRSYRVERKLIGSSMRGSLLKSFG